MINILSILQKAKLKLTFKDAIRKNKEEARVIKRLSTFKTSPEVYCRLGIQYTYENVGYVSELFNECFDEIVDMAKVIIKALEEQSDEPLFMLLKEPDVNFEDIFKYTIAYDECDGVEGEVLTIDSIYTKESKKDADNIVYGIYFRYIE